MGAVDDDVSENGTAEEDAEDEASVDEEEAGDVVEEVVGVVEEEEEVDVVAGLGAGGVTICWFPTTEVASASAVLVLDMAVVCAVVTGDVELRAALDDDEAGADSTPASLLPFDPAGVSPAY
jgi:hypothetical protein